MERPLHGWQDPAPFHRLRWMCRRGMLELDLVLERFLERGVPELSQGERADFVALLDRPDNDLWDLVIGRSDAVEDRCRGILARLRAA